jgi:NAD+ diphosphatase
MTGGYLDRDAATRLDDSALDAAWAEPGARLLRLRGGLVALSALDDHDVALDLIPVSGTRTPEHYYLGRADGDPIFAIALPQDSEPFPEPSAGWSHPFEFGWRISPLEAETMAVALAVAAWNESSPFSPRDGTPTEPAQGGWARLDAHGGEHFPRNDPVVIVLVEHEGRALLGSNVLWETGRFSLLAGFIEAGESAEQAVAREIFEESGARVADIRYMTSQPWPFPRSFMMGFRAKLAPGADPDALSPDPTELSEVRWFSRGELRETPPGITLPRPLSIARWLIDQWVAEGDEGESADAEHEADGRA